MRRYLQLLVLLCFCVNASSQTYTELNNRSKDFLAAKELDSAVYYSELALKRAEADYDSSNAASGGYYTAALSNLSFIYVKAGNDSAALPLLLKLLPLYQKVLPGSWPKYAVSAWDRLAGIYLRQGAFEEAGRALEQELDCMQRQHGDADRRALDLRKGVAAFYDAHGMPEKALPLLLEDVQMERRIGRDTSEPYLNSLRYLGKFYYDNGSFAAADSVFTVAQQGFEKAGSTRSGAYASLLNSRGVANNDLSNFALAGSLLQRSLDLRRALKDTTSEGFAASLNNLALVYRNQGRYASALLLVQRAIALWTTIGETNPSHLLSARNNEAALYFDLGKPEEAEPIYRSILQQLEVSGDTSSALYVTVQLGLVAVYEQLGLPEQNARILSSLLSRANWADRRGRIPQLAALVRMAKALAQVGQPKMADSLYQFAVPLLRESVGEHPYLATALSEQGLFYLEQKQFVAAAALLLEARYMWRDVMGAQNPYYANLLQQNALALYRLGSYVAASNLLQEALLLQVASWGANHPQLEPVFNLLARVSLAMGDRAKAETLFRRCFALETQTLNKSAGYLSEEEQSQRLTGSLTLLDEALTYLYLNSNASDSFVKGCFDFHLLVQGHALRSKQLLLQAVRKSSDPTVRIDFARWQLLRKEWGEAMLLPEQLRPARAEQNEQELARLEKSLAVRLSAFRQQIPQSGGAAATIRAGLGATDAALVFVSAQQSVHSASDTVLYGAFVVRKDAPPSFVALFDESRLRSSLHQVAAGKTTRGIRIGSGGMPAGGDTLYRLLWQPLEPKLVGVQRIFFSTAGLLQLLPFQAIVVTEGKLLMDRYQLRQYSSLRNLQASPDSAKMSTALLVGNARFGEGAHKAWEDLPGTGREVAALDAILRKSGVRTTVVTGLAAEEARVKAISGAGPSVLHLATHGYFLPSGRVQSDSANARATATDPLLRSGLVLAGANDFWSGAPAPAGKEDGLLSAYEIAQLDLTQVRLAVLSACETAVGDLNGTEGVFGLQRAFRLAGVPHLVVSLWQVPDRETAELMAAFYNRLAAGRPLHDALNEAKAEMRKSYAPYYWAGFILIE
ncbi:MAG: CHAT domain-containing protein [Sphingobacteriales bacterium]|nr:MAG: CHAT domain-containing protein [Sphingobacteriales bacterium]